MMVLLNGHVTVYFNRWYITVSTVSELCAALKRQPERNNDFVAV